MQGTIVKCLAEMVTEKFGRRKWDEVLERTGLRKDHIFLTTEDVDDQVVLKMVDSVFKILEISLVRAADAFGDYWINVYAPKIYHAYFSASQSAKEFLLRMNSVHQAMTQILPNARPPEFDYEWQDEKRLIIKYHSHRGLIDFVVGLAKGVGKYYKEDLTVIKRGVDQVQIIFP
ncbi:MAG: hypothetical protein GY832_39355 [Chloroflexi bacterium]|nr:hypothetical protein [Chloroflexota bacterium]